MATNTNTIKTRVRLKSDTEENWNKAGPKDGSLGFVPLLGELIVYTADDAHPFSRLKVGDGNTNVVSLPFIDAGTINGDTLEDEELMYANRNLFPSPGIENKLYIDLTTMTIYCYTNSGGYTKLSNFTYTYDRTTASNISNWSAGSPTTATVTGGALKIQTGVKPTLNYTNASVIYNITKEAT